MPTSGGLPDELTLLPWASRDSVSLERRVDPRQRLVKHRRLGALRPGQLRLFRDRHRRRRQPLREARAQAAPTELARRPGRCWAAVSEQLLAPHGRRARASRLAHGQQHLGRSSQHFERGPNLATLSELAPRRARRASVCSRTRLTPAQDGGCRAKVARGCRLRVRVAGAGWPIVFVGPSATPRVRRDGRLGGLSGRCDG
jgi:hypothetical protein